MSDGELETENDELRDDLRKCKQRLQELEKELCQLSHIEAPKLYDELEAIDSFSLDGMYYRDTDDFENTRCRVCLGDKGRVCKDSDTDDFRVTWYRTGLTTPIKKELWMNRFRLCGSGRIPVYGDEVQSLPGVSLLLEGEEYYKEGDKGRVCKNSAPTDPDGIDRFEVAWYRTGKVSTMITEMWINNFKLLLEHGISAFEEQVLENFVSKLNIDSDATVTREELKQSLESTVLSSTLANHRNRTILEPKLGDEMEALPNIELVVDSKQFYKGGDRGRVSKESDITESDGIERFEVTWYRTGLVSTMKSDSWMRNFKLIGGNVPLPVLGNEIMALPAARLTVNGKQYYKQGDTGTVCRDEYIDANDGITRIEIKWHRTGLITKIKTSVWFKYFKIVDASQASDKVDATKNEEEEEDFSAPVRESERANLSSLTEFGFAEDVALEVLRRNRNNFTAALDTLLGS